MHPIRKTITADEDESNCSMCNESLFACYLYLMVAKSFPQLIELIILYSSRHNVITSIRLILACKLYCKQPLKTDQLHRL